MVPCGGGGSGAGADSGLTGVDGRACVTVVAGGAVGLGRVGACPGGRVAGAGIVTLVRSGALNRIPADAETVLAHIGLGAGVTVVARRPRDRDETALAIEAGVLRAGILIVAEDRRARAPAIGIADVAGGAGVSVVADDAGRRL